MTAEWQNGSHATICCNNCRLERHWLLCGYRPVKPHARECVPSHVAGSLWHLVWPTLDFSNTGQVGGVATIDCGNTLMGTTSRQKPIRLHFKSAETVVVETDEEDRFVILEKEAAQACKQAQQGRQWAEQWREFLHHIHEWCKTHSDVIDVGGVMVGDSALNVLLFIKGHEYNWDIEDIIADLDLDLSQKFPACCAEVMQVPNQPDLKAGISQEELLVVYGDGNRASGSSKTQPRVP